MPILIRPSTDADIAAITAIYAPAVLAGTASWEIDPPDAAEMARRRAAILAEGFPYLVAEEGGRVVGYAYAGRYRPRPAYRYVVEDSIYVAHDRQNGGGIGSALLAALIGACEAIGMRQMIAIIGDSASAGSIRLHARFGFEQVGLLREIGWKNGRWLDQVIMQRPLGAGSSEAPRE